MRWSPCCGAWVQVTVLLLAVLLVRWEIHIVRFSHLAHRWGYIEITYD